MLRNRLGNLLGPVIIIAASVLIIIGLLTYASSPPIFITERDFQRMVVSGEITTKQISPTEIEVRFVGAGPTRSVVMEYPRDGRVRGRLVEQCYLQDCQLFSNWGPGPHPYQIPGPVLFRSLTDAQANELYSSRVRYRPNTPPG